MNTRTLSRLALTGVILLGLTGGCVGIEYSKTDTGDEPVSYGSLELSQSGISFGQALVDQTVSETLIVTNVGESAVELLSTTLTDGNNVYTLDGATTFPASIDASGELVLTLSFAPTSVATYSGTFDIETSDESIGAISIPLTGEGVSSFDSGDPDTGSGGHSTEGNVSVSPAALTYGTVDLGSSSTITLEITNTGTDNFLLSDFVTSDSQLDYSVDFGLPYVVEPGATKDVDITYTPTSETTLSATVTIDTDDADVEIPITGDCEDLCDVCTPLINVSTGGSSAYTIDDFSGIAMAGFNEDTRSITIQNVGDGEDPLVVTDVYVYNDSLFLGGTFTEDYSGTSTLDTYDSTTFNITFTVTDTTVEYADATTDTNVLHIISNDPYQADYQIQLSGIGLGF
jgi:hypothetical protein